MRNYGSSYIFDRNDYQITDGNYYYVNNNEINDVRDPFILREYNPYILNKKNDSSIKKVKNFFKKIYIKINSCSCLKPTG